MWAQTYPQDYLAYLALDSIYSTLGDDEKSVAALKEALKLNPASAVEYGNLVGTYLGLDRLAEAKAAAKEARDKNLDSPDAHRFLYIVDFLQHDPVAMEHDASLGMGKPGDEDWMLSVESDTAAYGGQFDKARELTRRAVESALRADETQAAASVEADAAMREALVGNEALANQQARTAITHSNARDVVSIAAFALALAGDTAHAIRLADDLDKRFPEDTFLHLFLPAIRAEAALRSGKTTLAMNTLAPTAPYDLGAGGLARMWLRGQVYLAANQGHEAAAEFQKILDHPGLAGNTIGVPLAHLGLGQAYALSGETTKARTGYEDFLAIWKDADPDLPILKQAKSEYAKLQ